MSLRKSWLFFSTLSSLLGLRGRENGELCLAALWSSGTLPWITLTTFSCRQREAGERNISFHYNYVRYCTC